MEKEGDDKGHQNEKEEKEEDEKKTEMKKRSKKQKIEEKEELKEENEYEYYENQKRKTMNETEKLQEKNIVQIPDIQPMAFEDPNKKLLKIMVIIVVVYLSLLIIVNVAYEIVSRRKKRNFKDLTFVNDEIRILDDMDMLRFSKLKDDLIITYILEGIVNLNKFYEENINEKPYSIPNATLNHIHISFGFSDGCINELIEHLSSALEHLSPSSFLHMHIMDADNLTLITFSKIMHMVHKINNNTEILVYNANHVRDDFKIREDKDPLFYIDYARLNAFKEIKDVKKIIMLKLENIMIEKDLYDLYSIDMDNIYGRGISEVPSIRHSVDWMEPYLSDKSHFINDAVILVNLELCQKDNFYNRSIEINNNEFYKKTEDPTQDILNILMKDKIDFFSPRFNKISFYENNEDKYNESKWYPWVEKMMKCDEKNDHFYTKEDLLNADSDPYIINYLWENKLGKNVKKYNEDKNKYAKINNFK